MTCKDCIHEDVCENYLKPFNFTLSESDTLKGLIKIKKSICSFEKDKSRIVELPCNVGDTVYEFYKPVNQIIPYEIEDIHIDKEQTRYFATAFDIYYNEYLDEIDFNEDEIGKTVFLTKEEAEKALKEKLK